MNKIRFEFIIGLFLVIVLVALAYVIVFHPNSVRPVPNPDVQTFIDGVTLDMTYSEMKNKFGAPSEDVGSGLMIPVYRLEGGFSVSFGFAGENDLVYVHLNDASGNFVDLLNRAVD